MLVGRGVELEALDAALRQALGGRGRLLLLSGEAGIGKTSLARALAERGSEGGATVRWGACWEGDGTAFGVWTDCLRRPGGDACARTLTYLVSGDRELGADPSAAERGRARFFTAVADALAEVSSEQPQVLVLEDVHWADDGSLQLLRALAPGLPSMRVLVIATHRSEEDPTGGGLSGLGGSAEPVVLDGLELADVVTLLTDVLGRAPTDEEARAVHRRTGGNPLFISQVARLVATGSSVRLPTGVRDVLSRRLARLGPDCDRLLGVAAVVGNEFTVPVLAAVAGATEDDVLRALDEAAAARLVVRADGDADRWSFAHDLVREARYEALGSADRADLHRRAVDVLGDRGTSAGRLAHHAARAHFEPGDDRPARFALAAGREALTRFAWNDAAVLCQRAIDVAPSGPGGDDVRAEAFLGLGDARLRSRGDAADAFTAAAEVGRRTGNADLVARAALGFGAGLGGFEVHLLDQRQIDLLEEAVSGLPADSPLRPAVLARLSVALSYVGSSRRRLELADEAVASARAHGDGRTLAAALAARCDVVAGPEHVTERLDASAEIVALAQRTGDLRLELLGRRLRVVALLESRDLSGFDAEVSAYARTAEQLSDPLYTWWAPMWRAARAHADGRFEEAERLGAEARAVGVAGGSSNADLLHLIARTFWALDRHDDDALAVVWQELVDRHPGLFHQAEAIGAMSAYRAARRGRVDEARSELRRLGGEAVERVPRDQEWLAVISQIVAAAVVTGDTELVRRGYELLLPYAGLGVFEGAAATDHGTVDRFLAVAAARLGDTEAARHHADAALLGNAGAGRLLIAHTHADAARALQHGGDDDRARAQELARLAIREYESLGLQALAGELRAVSSVDEAAVRDSGGPSLIREGDMWKVSFEGTTVRIRHAKGLADLAMLLSQSGRELHVRTLEGVEGVSPSSEHAMLDERAVAQYRTRLEDLEDDLAEAERNADFARAERLRAEHEALVDQLTGAFGLGGRARSVGSDPDERLRKAVSSRVKASINRIDDLHPALGRHLRNAVRTGYLCSYQPERPVHWQVTTGHRSR